MTPERESKFRRVISNRQPLLTVVMENIHDPHNISAILRTCDAVGVLDVYVINNSAPKPKFGRRSSASARKWVNARFFTSVEACYAELREKNFKIWATHLSTDAVSLYDLPLSEPAALVFGNEHAGVSDEACAGADGNFIIPMMGMIQSLNVSVACAVTLYEALRQRQNAGMYGGTELTQAQQQELFGLWEEKG
jgi:tRNA (guanosine-2'-O-)-methyltransferase